MFFFCVLDVVFAAVAFFALLPPAGAAGVFCFGRCLAGCCLADCLADFCADLLFCGVGAFFAGAAFFAGLPPADVFCFAFPADAGAPAEFGFFCVDLCFDFCAEVDSDFSPDICPDFCFCGVVFADAFFADPRCPVDFAGVDAAFGAGLAAPLFGAAPLLLRPRFLLAEAGALAAPPPLAFFFVEGEAFACTFFGCFSAPLALVGVAFAAFSCGFAAAAGALAALAVGDGAGAAAFRLGRTLFGFCSTMTKVPLIEAMIR